MAINQLYGNIFKLLNNIIIQYRLFMSNMKTTFFQLMHHINKNHSGIAMKRLFLLLFLLIMSFSLHAQTDKQIEEWREKGDEYAEQENFQEAIHYYELAKEAYGKLFSKEDDDYSWIQSTLAGFYASIGNSLKAIRIEYEQLEIAEKTSGTNSQDYAAVLFDLATYYSNIQNYSKAVEMSSKGLEIYKRALPGHPSYAANLMDVSRYYSLSGDHVKAIELCNEALDIQTEWYGEDYFICAMSLQRLAMYYNSLGDHTNAREFCTKAVNIFRNSLGEYHAMYIGAVNDLSIYCLQLGDYDKAKELCMMAVEKQKEKHGENNSEYAMYLSNLSLIYFQSGDFLQALELSKRAMEIDRTVSGESSYAYSRSSSNLAIIHNYLGNYALAVDFGKKTMTIRKTILGEHHPDYAYSLINLAYYYSNMGSHAEALRYLREGLTILQDHTFRQIASLTAYNRSVFWDNCSCFFTDYYPYFTYRTKTTTAPDLYDKSALFAKGLILSTEIEMNRLILESGDEEALRMLEELQLNRQQLHSLYEAPIAKRHINNDSLAKVVDRQEQALVMRSKVYGDYTRKMRTTWQEVRNALDKDEISIEFLSFNVIGSDSTMLAAVTLRKDSQSPKFIPLFEQGQLKQISDTMYYHCPELTALVWRPLQQELQGIRRIFFSPAGALHNIGIEYAPGMEDYEMYRLSTTREIIDKKNITAPFAQSDLPAYLYGGVDYNSLPLTQGQSAKTTGDTGDRSLNIQLHRALIDRLNLRGADVGLSDLPGTKKEVEDIKRLFDNCRQTSTLYTGTQATESSVKRISGHPPYILHIATHGFYFTKTQSQVQLPIYQQFFHERTDYEDKALSRSGLFFAGANTLKDQAISLEADDGILTAQEVSRLDLRGLGLVVLSACKTGNGEISQGEGVFGLQRGFKKAGAQALVMSLWEVNDTATQILMTAFYDNLLQRQSKRDAFRHAQQHLIKADNGRYDSPKYWAAFILLD